MIPTLLYFFSVGLGWWSCDALRRPRRDAQYWFSAARATLCAIAIVLLYAPRP